MKAHGKRTAKSKKVGDRKPERTKKEKMPSHPLF